MLELIGDHPGLVVLAIARAVDESDRAKSCFGGQRIKRLRLAVFREFHVVPRLKLRPPSGVVAEPLAELGARAEISGPGVESQRLLRAPSGPDPVDQHAMTIIWARLVVGPLKPDVRHSHQIGPSSGRGLVRRYGSRIVSSSVGRDRSCIEFDVVAGSVEAGFLPGLRPVEMACYIGRYSNEQRVESLDERLKR